MNKLVVVEGPLRGKTFEVTELASIGRGDTCAVRLDGRHISRIHARMEKRGDSMVIRDNGSRNGIFVNGQNVREAVLRPDDEVEIGEHVLIFDPTSDPAKRARASATVLESLADPFAAPEADGRLSKLLSTAAAIVEMEDEKSIARLVLDTLMEAVSPERGFVMAVGEGGILKPIAKKAPAGDEEFYLSSVLYHEISKERRSLIAADVKRRQPDLGKRIGILCAPLGTKGGFLGVTYLDVKLPEGEVRPKFTSADLRFAASLSVFASHRVDQILRVPPPAKIGQRPLNELRAAFEKECVAEAIRRTKGNLDAAAKLLGLTRPTLDEKLKVLGLVSSQETAAPVEWKSVQP